MGFTRRQALLAALLANAIRAIRNRFTVVPVFFAGWLTGELAPQLIAAQAIDTAVSVRKRKASKVALALAAINAAGLVWLAKRSNAVPDQIDLILRGLDVPEDLEPRQRLRSSAARPFRFAEPGVEVLHNIPYTEGGRRAHLDIYRPEAGATDAPVLIQVHGGGWSIGHKRQQGLLLMNRMAARGWVCVAVNYRLAPRYRWPTQIIDVKRSIAWVREHIAEYGGDPDYFVLTGGSAGGHLSALAALTPDEKQWQPGFEADDTSVAACVPFYGGYDFAGDDVPTRMMREMFLSRFIFPPGATADDFEDASPLRRVRADAPDFLILHGENDSLFPVPKVREFVEQLREISDASVTYVELPLTQHAFEVFGSVRARHTIRGVQRWLEWHHARWQSEHRAPG
ncbi:MAG TPA: alpha/beta hydrolase [Aeromicrobium sp.]|nr:alpha/beta hydrolase [Aeromicrobium sp.]